MVPTDDPRRRLVSAKSDDRTLPHLGVVGDTYTILLSGEDTAGRFCLIDMHIPPGGGPPPHRHDFEETFTVLEGELAMTFRGQRSVARAGETIHIPANAPHQFHNSSGQAARLLCICAPAGQERFFMEVGVPVATQTTPPPTLDEAGQAAFIAKAKALAPKYRTELLEHARWLVSTADWKGGVRARRELPGAWGRKGRTEVAEIDLRDPSLRSG